MQNQIRTLRKARKLTQVELATALGVNETTVVRWEKGHTTIPLPTLTLIARFFRVPLTGIIPELDTIPAPTGALEEVHSA